MDFTEKEIQNAIRKYNALTNDVLNAAGQVYQDRVKKLVNFLRSDKVMKHFIAPYLELEVKIDQYIQKRPSGWDKLTIPPSVEEEIAFALKILFESVDENFDLINWGISVVKETKYDLIANKLNNRIFSSVFRELNHKFQEIFNNKTKGKNRVDSSSLQIINYGNIDTENSNIAIGKNITQSQEIGLKEDIIKELLAEGFSFDKVKKIENDIDKITEEISKEKPDKSLLRKCLSHIYEVGEKTAINVLSNTISSLTFIAVADQFVKSLA